MNVNKNYSKVVGTVILLLNFSLKGSTAPYVPSYDEKYAADIRQAQQNKDYFIEPDDSLNYVHYHYIGAHAAEKYARFFPQFALQDQPIPGELYAGVRGLMLSVYNWSLTWSSILRDGISVVCSNPLKEAIVFRTNGKPLYQTLHYEMNRIFNFLKSHPKAIITILCDDFADMLKISRDIQEIIMKNNYDPFLKPADWPAAQQKGEWPTLGWMRQHNKRLLLFTQTHDRHTEFTWPIKQYFWENVSGTVDENLVCVEEKDSVLESAKKNRTLVCFGVFGGVAVVPDAKEARDPKLCFEYDFAKKLTQNCQQKKFAQGKLFNGYWADHILNVANGLTKEKKKTAFDYINELNIVSK